MSVVPGSPLGHYRIAAALGAGGMGEVYRARDTKLGREVAIKVLPDEVASDEERLARFDREAHVLASLNHPNIATLFGFETEGDTSFLIMELVEGETLTERIARGPIPVSEAMSLFLQIAEGLEAAHDKGVIHRDLKPANIKITNDRRIKILDFGLAKAMEPEVTAPDLGHAPVITAAATGRGEILGSAAYMSPEQARGEEVDQRTDLWSLGVVLYEMLTGRRPFRGEREQAVMHAILSEEPETLTSLRPKTPEAVERVLVKTLTKDRNARYRDAGELARDLRSVRQELEHATTRSSLPRRARRRRVLAGAVLAAVVLGSAGVVWWRTVSSRQGAHIEGRVGDQSAVGAETVRPRIAVLPFVNMSPDPDQQYLADGMAEEIINALTKIPGLQVMGRSSAFRFREERDIPTIAKELNVSSVLDGSVRKEGDRLRITVQLVKVADGIALWSERYDRELGQIFEIQDEISREIVGRLGPTLVTESDNSLVEPSTSSLEAYELFFRARQHWQRGEFEDAIDLLKEAIELDPHFARAYALLSEQYTLLVLNAPRGREEAILKAREAAWKALEIDAGSAEAYAALCFQRLFGDWDRHGAEAACREALDLNPGSSEAHYRAAFVLDTFSRSDEAIHHLRRVVALDPFMVWAHGYFGDVLRTAGRYEEAIDRLQTGLDLDPRSIFARVILRNTYRDSGMEAEAVDATLEVYRLLELPERARELGEIYTASGAPAMWRRELKYLIKDYEVGRVGASPYPPDPFSIALDYCRLGEWGEAVSWFEKGYVDHEPRLVYLEAVMQQLPELASQPRFLDLLRRMGLVD